MGDARYPKQIRIDITGPLAHKVAEDEAYRHLVDRGGYRVCHGWIWEETEEDGSPGRQWLCLLLEPVYPAASIVRAQVPLYVYALGAACLFAAWAAAIVVGAVLSAAIV